MKRKNLRPLGGRPLLEYTVEAARASKLDRVVLTTEAEEIAEVGRAAGAEVPFLRPQELARGEGVRALEIVLHALARLEEIDGWSPDAVMFLQPTSPFREAKHIDEAFAILADNEVDSVMAATPVSEHPYYMLVPAAQNRLVPYTYLHDLPERRQDLPPVYSSNNAIMLSRTSYLRGADASCGMFVNYADFLPIMISGDATVDINTEEDFSFAEYLMLRRQGGSG